MRLFGKVDGRVDRFDRAQWLSVPFDLAYAALSLYPDIMSAVRSRLLTVDGIDEVQADEADPTTPLPYVVHSTASEEPRRFFGGRIGEGGFEIGVYAHGYEEASDLLENVRGSLDTWVNGSPVALSDGGRIFYVRSQAGTTRSISVPSPGGGVAHYARMMQFSFKVARSEG